MEVNCSMKQEDNRTSLYPQVSSIATNSVQSWSGGLPSAFWTIPDASNDSFISQKLPLSDDITVSFLSCDKTSLTPDLSPISSDTKVHVPRPPNAFMLFRSDLLKRRCIPDHVERRQQHLSRVAGQAWNALGPKEKAFWQEKAAQVLLEHQLKNPNYKFTPAPRGSRRGKGKGRLDTNGDDVDEEARIRQIREKYVIPGPTVAPARRRRPRHQNLIRDADITLAHYSTVSEPSRSPASSLPPSPAPFFSPEFDYRQEATLPPCWPQHTLPQVMPPRRPSTSLGFATATPSSMRPTLAMATSRSSPAASDTAIGAYMGNMNLPPTASKIPPPPSTLPVYPLQPANSPGSFLSDSAPVQDEVTFPNPNSSFTSTPSPESLSTPETMGSESFLDSLCINDPFTFNLPIASAEDQFTALQNTYFDYPSASQGPWPTFDVSAFGEASSFAHVRSYST